RLSRQSPDAGESAQTAACRLTWVGPGAASNRARCVSLASLPKPFRLLAPLLLCAATADSSPAREPLRPIAITRFVEYGAGGGCLLRADGKGRLYLLSAKSLTAFRFSAGALAAKSRMPLKARNPPGLVLDAAACSDDDWVILDLNPAPTVRLFVRGEEKVLPQPEWGVNGVACPGGSPAVVVSPGKPSGAPVGPLSSTAPDLMLRWDGETWAPYVDRLLDLRGKASGWEFVEKSEAASQVVTTTDHRGWLWVGQ